MSDSPRFQYRWWPLYRPDAAELADHGNVRAVVLMDALAAAVFAIPVVARASGVPWWLSTPLFALHAVWVVCSMAWLFPRAHHSINAFRAWIGGNLLSGEGVCIAVVMVARDPNTPLWVLPVVYASFNGVTPSLGPSWILMLVHTAAPVATIPYFLAIGSPVGWSVAGPIIAGLISFIGYHYLQVRGHVFRVVEHERDQALAKLREQELRAQRAHIARELHDSVGASLAAAAVVGDLIGSQAASPEVKQLGSNLREAAREGLADLRGVLDGISPGREDAGAMCDLLRKHASRCAPPGVTVEVASDGPGDVLLDSTSRLVVLRCFQEALNNAVRHGSARRIGAAVSVTSQRIRLEVRDDGAGFDPASVDRGRGLDSMEARARELGGRCLVDAAPGRGTTVVIELPWRAVTPVATPTMY